MYVLAAKYYVGYDHGKLDSLIKIIGHFQQIFFSTCKLAHRRICYAKCES